MSNKKDTKKNLVFKNKKAFHDFTILDTLEAGIMLEGSEVKAIREGRINLKDSFVRIIKENSLWILEKRCAHEWPQTQAALEMLALSLCLEKK